VVVESFFLKLVLLASCLLKQIIDILLILTKEAAFPLAGNKSHLDPFFCIDPNHPFPRAFFFYDRAASAQPTTSSIHLDLVYY